MYALTPYIYLNNKTFLGIYINTKEYFCIPVKKEKEKENKKHNKEKKRKKTNKKLQMNFYKAPSTV